MEWEGSQGFSLSSCFPVCVFLIPGVKFGIVGRAQEQRDGVWVTEVGSEPLGWALGDLPWMIQVLHPNIHPETNAPVLSPPVPTSPHPGRVWDEDGEEKGKLH